MEPMGLTGLEPKKDVALIFGGQLPNLSSPALPLELQSVSLRSCYPFSLFLTISLSLSVNAVKFT